MCSQLEPLPDTSQSPPAHECGQNFNRWNDPWEEDDQFHYQPENAHIRGVPVSTSGICGNPNQVSQGNHAVCGKSFDTIKEEIVFDYLEKKPTWLARHI